jgi:hypothetical protein
VLAPPGIRVKESPVQIVPLFTVTVGVILTVIELTATLEDTQPSALLPVTLMLVFVNGDKIVVPLE